jgi:hypothetical protein
MKSQIKVVLRDPLDKKDQINYIIDVEEHALAQAWITALKSLLESGNLLEKNFCFMGFPTTGRNIEFLCTALNRHIKQINQGLDGYAIDDVFSPANVFAHDHSPMGVNHDLFNRLHNHFEILQGTVDNFSTWYINADYKTKYSIRQLNLICHEMENLILGLRKAATNPFWVRPSQITTWINAPRYKLEDVHRQGFVSNGYDRVLGGVYMHWAQIGKTLMEVFRDEGAPELTTTVCEAITHLEYYSGEFDVEWGNNITVGGGHPWHDKTIGAFREWLIENNLDPQDPKLSLGYLPVGQVNLKQSFGTEDYEKIWDIMGRHLDIYSIEVDGVQAVYDYCWSDADYEQQQIDRMRPGYDYHSRKIL